LDDRNPRCDRVSDRQDNWPAAARPVQVDIWSVHIRGSRCYGKPSKPIKAWTYDGCGHRSSSERRNEIATKWVKRP